MSPAEQDQVSPGQRSTLILLQGSLGLFALLLVGMLIVKLVH
jgi:hypothetical protein